MKAYEFFDHTADAKFRAYGKTLEEAFVNAAKATAALIVDVEKVQPKLKHEIKIEAKKPESLLFDFMDQLIFLVDTEGFICCDVENLVIEEREGACKLTGVALGDKADGYDVFSHIKAPTYSDMFIREEDGRYIIQMVHDL